MTTTTSRIIIAQSQEPSGILGIPSKCTKFFVNRKYALEHSIGRTHSGQMHVELHQLYDAVEGKVRKNIVFLHGDFFTGDTWGIKSHGGQGWAAYFLKQGYNVFLVDLPGVGKSKFLDENDYQVPGEPRTVRSLTVDRMEQEFTASEHCPLPDGSLAWFSAAKHTQWPGTGRRGDTIFDYTMDSTTSMVLPKLQHEELGTIAVRDLLEKIGPSFLLGHGTGATIGMLTADAVPRLVRGLISIEPDGPPCAVAGREVEGRMIYSPYLKYDPNIRKYGISDAPFTFSPAPQPAPGEHPLKIQVRQHPANAGCYMAQEIFPKMRIYNMRKAEGQELVPQLVQLVRVPHVVVTSQSSPNSVYDWAFTNFIRQAGAVADWYYLPNQGFFGNGHLMHLEKNSDDIAQHLDRWVTKVPLKKEDDDLQKRLDYQKERQQRTERPVPLMNGPRDEPFEVEFVVQPDDVETQASSASPVATADATGSDTSVDPTGSVTSVEPTSSDTSVDPTGSVTSVEPTSSVTSVDLAGPVDTIDPRMLSFGEIEAQAFRPPGDFDPYQAPDQAWGPYPSPDSFGSAETLFFDTADADVEMLEAWTPSLEQVEFGLATAGISEIEDMFNNEWKLLFDEDLAQEDLSQEDLAL
ncbi:Alpha/beta hydrolase family domain-containing protein [Trichoderma sp. SZMC 28014]